MLARHIIFRYGTRWRQRLVGNGAWHSRKSLPSNLFLSSSSFSFSSFSQNDDNTHSTSQSTSKLKSKLEEISFVTSSQQSNQSRPTISTTLSQPTTPSNNNNNNHQNDDNTNNTDNTETIDNANSIATDNKKILNANIINNSDNSKQSQDTGRSKQIENKTKQAQQLELLQQQFPKALNTIATTKSEFTIDQALAPPTSKKKKKKKVAVIEEEKPIIPLIPIQVKPIKKKKVLAEAQQLGQESADSKQAAGNKGVQGDTVTKSGAQSTSPATVTETTATTATMTKEGTAPPKKRKWTPREWVIYIGQQRAQWNAQKKASAMASLEATKEKLIAAPIKLKAAPAAMPFDIESLDINVCDDDKQRTRDVNKFASMVSWMQFRNFMVQFHKSKWQNGVLDLQSRYKSYVTKCCKIFDWNDAREVIETITPHLHNLTPELLYEARKNSIEGIPLLGDTPYLAAFVPEPVSCPCARPPVSGEAKSDLPSVKAPSSPLKACICYPTNNLEIHNDCSRETVKQRISNLTKKGTKVFVENLHPEIGVKELMKMFCKIGQVQAVEIFRERLTGEGAEPLASILAPEEEVKAKEKKRPPLKRQVTGQSPVYAWVYFSEKRGEQRALHPVIRLLGVNFLKHEARTHPADERKTLYLGNLPLIPPGGLETYIVTLLTNGEYKANAKLVHLLNPPPQYQYKKDTLIKESARYGFCLAEFIDHASALSAFHKLAGLSLPQDGSYPVDPSKPSKPLRVGWHTTDPSMRHEAAKHESTRALRARQGEIFYPVQTGDPFASVAQDYSSSLDRLISKDESGIVNGHIFSSDDNRINGHHSSQNGHGFHEFLGNGQTLR